MYIRNFLILLIASIIIGGCSKDEESVLINGKFYDTIILGNHPFGVLMLNIENNKCVSISWICQNEEYTITDNIQGGCSYPGCYIHFKKDFSEKDCMAEMLDEKSYYISGELSIGGRHSDSTTINATINGNLTIYCFDHDLTPGEHPFSAIRWADFTNANRSFTSSVFY